MAFFGHFEKLNHDNLKTGTIHHENFSKISEKLEHHRLNNIFMEKSNLHSKKS